jgi:CPA2 family monovalent cation:H+ antiporter-2
MEHTLTLTNIAVVIVAALACGLVFARIKQPPIIGYILAGIVLGPSGFKIIEDREPIELFAEMGVLLLLYVIGMELNLQTFKRVWKVATLCVVLQIAGSLGITFALSHLFGWSTGLSILLGFVIAISSTAVVVKVLESIGELRTETGQLAIGVLIAQDLAIVPMILILKNMDRSWFDPIMLLKFFGSIAFIVVLILYLGRRQRVRLPFTQIITTDRDLTSLMSLTFCFAAAAFSGVIGLSAAYGAFLAGFVLGNTHERVLMIETTKPIQSILMMAFFFSIGLLLDIQYLWNQISVVLILLFIISIGKTAMNIGILHILRIPWAQAFLAGVVLSQLGEFAFLLTTVGSQAGIINDVGEKLIICLTVLSLTFSPLWLNMARRLRSFVDVNIGFKGLLASLYSREVHKIRDAYQSTGDEAPPSSSLDKPKK